MKWLVVGASGLVGSHLAAHLANAADTEVVGVARSVGGAATQGCDLDDLGATRRVLAEVKPDVVVVASAWPHVDGCEADPARSFRENVGTVQKLASLASADVSIVFFSTDHVFDGAKPVYVESDDVRPLSVYAQHKREVEELLLERGNALVVRTAWVFGVEARKKNFVYRVIDAARRKETLRVPAGQIGCPTWAPWLAESTKCFVDERMRGIVHATGKIAMTKAEWAKTIVRELALPEIEIIEVPARESGQVAPRPDRVVLGTERHTRVHPDVRDVLRRERAALTF